MATVLVRRVESRLVSRVSDHVVRYGELCRTPDAVHALLRSMLEHEAQEVFCALLLDGKHRVTGYVEVTRGTLTASLVHPREVFGAAVRLGAAAIIVAHNHPSGDPEPSAEDLAVTERLRQAGDILGIPLQDHVIIGADGQFTSLRGRMNFR